MTIVVMMDTALTSIQFDNYSLNSLSGAVHVHLSVGPAGMLDQEFTAPSAVE